MKYKEILDNLEKWVEEEKNIFKERHAKSELINDKTQKRKESVWWHAFDAVACKIKELKNG